MNDTNLMKANTDGAEMTAKLLEVLDSMCGIKTLFRSADSAIVCAAGDWYLLSDSYGEISIQKINHDHPYTSIPTATHPITNVGTVAYRLSAVLHGREPNWDLDAAEMCGQVLRKSKSYF